MSRRTVTRTNAFCGVARHRKHRQEEEYLDGTGAHMDLWGQEAASRRQQAGSSRQETGGGTETVRRVVAYCLLPTAELRELEPTTNR